MSKGCFPTIPILSFSLLDSKVDFITWYNNISLKEGLILILIAITLIVLMKYQSRYSDTPSNYINIKSIW